MSEVERLLMSIEGMLAVIIVLIAIIVLKRIQARARQERGGPDIIIPTEQTEKD